MRVLVACEFSGIVRDAFAARGHDAWSCDLSPTERPGNHIAGDVLAHLSEGWDLVIAHPPCTDLASAGAAAFARKVANGTQERARQFFMAFINAGAAKIAVENPVGVMSRLYRKPDQIIQPWQFGHPLTKSTCLWLKNLPALVPTNIVAPAYKKNADGTDYRDAGGSRYSEIHYRTGRMSDTERQRERSRTFQGIADAMAAQWGAEISCLKGEGSDHE